jgi:hypothetical protein
MRSTAATVRQTARVTDWVCDKTGFGEGVGDGVEVCL